MTPLPIHFAPLQGYTGDVYRRIHHRLLGGISQYYTPFLRMEGGSVRSKDIRDINPEFNEGVPVIPQVIAKNMKEFDFLTQTVEERGYKHIDINMGCPFPMQAKHGRGSGLLAHVDILEEMANAIAQKTDITFSVKMRLGWENMEEWKPALDILNQIPLSHSRQSVQPLQWHTSVWSTVSTHHSRSIQAVSVSLPVTTSRRHQT